MITNLAVLERAGIQIHRYSSETTTAKRSMLSLELRCKIAANKSYVFEIDLPTMITISTVFILTLSKKKKISDDAR